MVSTMDMIFWVCILLVQQQLIRSETQVESYRILHLDDVMDDPKWNSNHRKFHDNDIGAFTQFALHLETNSAFLGANNSVIRLDIKSLEKVDQVIWSSSRELTEACKMKTGSGNGCAQNSVTLLLPVNDAFHTVTSSVFRVGLYTCWTNGIAAECSLRQAADLRGPPKILWSGLNQCPAKPNEPVIATAATNRQLYMGTRFITGDTSIIAIESVSSRFIEQGTASSDVPHFAQTAGRLDWIVQDGRTVFVHSFEFHNAIYFIFREMADEVKGRCNKEMIISRVGRVCLSDKGGRDGRLRSFAKATIICPSQTMSQTESTILVHREVNAVYVDQGTKTMFAVFTTPRTMPASSTVCAYRLTDIEDVFKGPFYTSSGEPTKFDNANDCESSNLRSTWFEHHQMYRTVRPKLDQSIMRKEKARWSHLVVDWMPTTLKTDNNLILFTVDPDRQIISKWHHFKGETCLIEELRVLRTPPRTTDTNIERILRIELIRAGQPKEVFPETTLFIATTEHLFRLPVARCERLGHRYEFCEAVHDPYCGWNKRQKRCELLNLATTTDDSMVLFDSCPILRLSEQQFSIHGGRGSWSPWSACRTFNDDTQLTGFVASTAGQMLTASLGDSPSRPLEIQGCDCRYRFCSSPYPFGKDAKPCTEGPSVQLANCSVNGHWTEWSSWSACEPACVSSATPDKPENSPSVRTRRRWCLNPAAAGNTGKPCVGQAKETVSCPTPKILCPAEQLPNPIWSEWSAWSECSAACSGGRQIRWRQCGRREPGWRLPSQNQISIQSIAAIKSASADSDKILCLGNAYEERPCNEDQCPVTKVTSSWTTWYVTDGDLKSGTTERRYRVECVATVPEVDKLQAGTQMQTGECLSDETSGEVTCHTTVDDALSSSKSNFVNKPWMDNKEADEMWSAWTDCSRPCGSGVRYRWRPKPSHTNAALIIPSGEPYATNADRQEEICNTQPCPGRWSCWTAWSVCTQPVCSSVPGEQRRHRSCLVPNSVLTRQGEPMDISQCDGGAELAVQSRPCEVTIDEVKCYRSGSDTTRKFKRMFDTPLRESKANNGVYSSTESTPWAAWSECLRVKGLQYDIRVRARENCLNCELVQAQRCDTGQFVILSEVLAFYESSQTAGQNITDPRLYTLAHAISVVIAATLIGAALILIPYTIYLSRSSKRERQREILERSSIWRKLIDRKHQIDGQNLPYIWFAETQNGKMRTVRKRPRVSVPKDNNGNKLKTMMATPEWKRMKNPASDMIGTPNSNAPTIGFPNVNLTRIQALHNDHRIAPEMTTHTTHSYPVHEPVSSRWNGLNPCTLDPDEVKPRSHPRYSPIESNQTHRKLITPTYGSKNNELSKSWNKPVLPDNTAVFPDTHEALPSVMDSGPGSKQPDENGIIYATSLVR